MWAPRAELGRPVPGLGGSATPLLPHRPRRMLFELFVVVALVLVNGALAMSELAVVSSRPARLKVLADRDVGGAQAALALAENPGRFLSTVQIGITLVGVLAGAFSGATLGSRLAASLIGWGLTEAVAEPIAFGLVVAVITYLSLIIGELVPKQIALRDPERVACIVAPAMALLSRATAPVVHLLDISGRAVLRLLGLAGARNETVTEEEIRTLVAEANTAGVIEHGEVEMISRVMGLGDRPVRAMMTPRVDVDVIDLTDTADEIRAAILASPHSRMPAREGPDGDILGVVQAKTLLDAFLAGRTPDPREFVTPTPVVPDTADALDVINALKSSPLNMALVYDEYGHFEGVVTTSDILEAITGSFAWSPDTGEPDVVVREDGSSLVSGAMALDAFTERFGLQLAGDTDFTTAAGWVLAELKRLPSVGECFEAQGYRVEVIDLDGRRIDKILVTRLPDPEVAAPPAT